MDDKDRPNDMAANLKAIADAAQRPDDEVEIAADDQGVSAMAQKLDKPGNGTPEPQKR